MTHTHAFCFYIEISFSFLLLLLSAAIIASRRSGSMVLMMGIQVNGLRGRDKQLRCRLPLAIFIQKSQGGRFQKSFIDIDSRFGRRLKMRQCLIGCNTQTTTSGCLGTPLFGTCSRNQSIISLEKIEEESVSGQKDTHLCLFSSHLPCQFYFPVQQRERIGPMY